MTDLAGSKRGGGARISRRNVLRGVGAAGAAVTFGTVGAPMLWAQQPAAGLRKIKLAWNATAICTASAPTAKERGIFAKHGLDVEFVNFGGSTETLLEAIATGKADAGIGMALRWLKPLEQGFDVKLTAGIHGGCLRLIGSKTRGTTTLESLKGKVIAISDQASPAKNFFSLYLAKRGYDPAKDFDWRQYPADLLPLAVQKGEAQALADADPRTYLFLKDQDLVELATNLTGEYAKRTCCILAVRGSLVRDEKPIAAALTKAVLEGGKWVAQKPEDAAAIFSAYGGKGSVEDLTKILNIQDHHDQPLGDNFKEQLTAYIDELKIVNVIRQRTDSKALAAKIYEDVLT